MFQGQRLAAIVAVEDCKPTWLRFEGGKGATEDCKLDSSTSFRTFDRTLPDDCLELGSNGTEGQDYWSLECVNAMLFAVQTNNGALMSRLSLLAHNAFQCRLGALRRELGAPAGSRGPPRTWRYLGSAHYAHTRHISHQERPDGMGERLEIHTWWGPSMDTAKYQ